MGTSNRQFQLWQRYLEHLRTQFRTFIQTITQNHHPHKVLHKMLPCVMGNSSQVRNKALFREVCVKASFCREWLLPVVDKKIISSANKFGF